MSINWKTVLTVAIGVALFQILDNAFNITGSIGGLIPSKEGTFDDRY